MADGRPVVSEEDNLIAGRVRDLWKTSYRCIFWVREGVEYLARKNVTRLNVVAVTVENVYLVGTRVSNLT